MISISLDCDTSVWFSQTGTHIVAYYEKHEPFPLSSRLKHIWTPRSLIVNYL